MGASHPAELVERTRILVETTGLPVQEIAAEVGVHETTVRRWIAKHGWSRPPGGTTDRRRKIAPSKHPALRRLYEGGAKVRDLAVLADCSMEAIVKIASRGEWTRPAGRHNQEASRSVVSGSALAEIEGALRNPNITRAEFNRVAERAAAEVALQALHEDHGRAERLLHVVERLPKIIARLPEDSAVADAASDRGGQGNSNDDDARLAGDDDEIHQAFARRLQDFYG
jgi:transposase